MDPAIGNRKVLSNKHFTLFLAVFLINVHILLFENFNL